MLQKVYIDTSSEKAQALLSFLRTLDFVKEEKNYPENKLTQEHENIVGERRVERMTGKSKTVDWETVRKNSLS